MGTRGVCFRDENSGDGITGVSHRVTGLLVGGKTVQFLLARAQML